MKNIVFVPAFNRPEMLFLTLEALTRAEGIEDHEVWVIQDNKKGRPVHAGIAEVAHEFEKRLDLAFFLRPPNACPGNRENYLTAYRVIHTMEAPFCFLVEEDVIVSRDFFRWHYAVLAKEKLFCSVGMAHADLPHKNDPSEYRKKHGMSCLGTCFPRESLPLIFAHANDDYYLNAREYLLREFPEKWFGDGHNEQDGLIARIMVRHRLWGAFPDVSRCFHVGINGYNRRGDTRLAPGTWRQQAEELRSHWSDPAWMTADYPDCMPSALEIPPWTEAREGEPVEA